MIDRASLRLSATLLLAGQFLYIVVTQFHAGGDTNNHPVIFAGYARSGDWTAVHLGQFASMAILVAGLLALFYALDVQARTARWAGRFGTASAVVALALSGLTYLVLGGRLRGLLGHAHDPDPAGLGPQPWVDDLAGRCRLADAGFAGPPPRRRRREPTRRHGAGDHTPLTAGVPIRRIHRPRAAGPLRWGWVPGGRRAPHLSS
jgi:hypothetical protein